MDPFHDLTVESLLDMSALTTDLDMSSFSASIADVSLEADDHDVSFVSHNESHEYITADADPSDLTIQQLQLVPALVCR